ncbi:helix-turn-helix domain-containing protein [Streptomyces sp. enrichment culture]|uniref:helix-turn-helix domain-containing protein n=1 Tax=Streptomyces sp. enrichment culture TaxID=1795815 RepID=UPI003F56037A
MGQGEGRTVTGDTAAAEFAALLRELKGRSGLSYGTLAKRLHVSTSTLHRYCNGDAVPTDYAPVERLARLCKASPGELVDLHRRWVLADATRGRKGAGAAGPPGVPGASGAPGSSDPSGSSGSDGSSVSDGSSGPDRASGPDGTSGPDGSSGSGGSSAEVRRSEGTSPSGGTSPEEAPRPEESPSSEEPRPSGEPRPSEELRPPVELERPHSPERFPERPVPSRARRRTRGALVAGIAVAAVAGAVTLAVSLSSGGADEDRRGPAGAVSVEARGAGGARVSASPSRPASPSASPSRKKNAEGAEDGKDGGDGSAADGTGPAASPSGNRGEGGAGEGSAVTGTRAGAPLTVSVQPYTWENPCDQRYLVNRPPARVAPPPTEQDAPAWVAAMGAVPSGRQFLTLTVQGTGEETVVVKDLKVRTVGKRSPLAWNDYVMGYPGVGCGGGVTTRSFAVALDAARPAVVPQAGGDDFPFKVSESDPEVYYVLADASAYDVSWYLELEWSSGSRSGTLEIGDDGRPFRTSGNNGRPAYEFPLGGEKWVKEGTTVG